MFDINSGVVEHHEQTVALNWRYRLRYLIEHVLFAERLLALEHQPPYWLIHYRSDEYGLSQARVNEAELASLYEENPAAEALLSVLPVTVVEPTVDATEQLSELLAEVVERPQMPRDPEAIIPKRTFAPEPAREEPGYTVTTFSVIPQRGGGYAMPITNVEHVPATPAITILDIPEGPNTWPEGEEVDDFDYGTMGDAEDEPDVEALVEGGGLRHDSVADELKRIAAANPGRVLVVHSSPAAAAASPYLVAVKEVETVQQYRQETKAVLQVIAEQEAATEQREAEPSGRWAVSETVPNPPAMPFAFDVAMRVYHPYLHLFGTVLRRSTDPVFGNRYDVVFIVDGSELCGIIESALQQAMFVPADTKITPEQVTEGLRQMKLLTPKSASSIATAKIVDYMGEALDLSATAVTPADIKLMTAHGIIKPVSADTKVAMSMLEQVAAQVKDAPPQAIGGVKPKAEKKVKPPKTAKAEQERKPIKAAKQLMALPKLPEPVVLPHLVIPGIPDLLMRAERFSTPEMQRLTSNDKTVPTIDWYVSENSEKVQSADTLWDTILNRGVADLRYWMAPTLSRWTNEADIGVRWKPLPFATVLSTATGFFAGRALGIALTHRDGHEEAHGDQIGQLLEIEMNNQFTPEVLQAMLGELIPGATSASMERVRLVGRLLAQLLTTARQPLPNYTSAQVAALKGENKEWHALVWACRDICWHLNLTEPSGYAFLHGLRTPTRIFFSRQEEALLNNLLRLTGKVMRP